MAMAIRGIEGYVRDNTDAGFIDPRKIVIRPGFNPRSKVDLEANIEVLIPQIVAAKRVRKPVLIYRDGPDAVLLGGETRVRSILRLIEQRHPDFLDEKWPKGIVQIPFTVDGEAALDEETRLLRAISDNEGRGLNDFDRGAAYTRLIAFGHDVDWIVEQTGLSKRYVSSCLELAPAPAEVRQAVSEGKLSRGAAVQAVKKGSQVAREVAVKAIASSEGKKVTREKAAPKTVDALNYADQLAEMVLADNQEWDGMMTLARKYQRLRKKG